MARVPARQPPAWSEEGRGVEKEVREVARDLATTRAELPEQRVQPGTIVLFSTAQAPGAKWRACDGAAISRFDYPEIFLAIGETHGAGDGSTTFELPDLTAAAPATTAYWIFVGRE